MPTIDGVKYACEPCMRGHRSTKCMHSDRILVQVRKPGRPLSSCPHSEGRCDCTGLRMAIPKASGCACVAGHSTTTTTTVDDTPSHSIVRPHALEQGSCGGSTSTVVSASSRSTSHRVRKNGGRRTSSTSTSAIKAVHDLKIMKPDPLEDRPGHDDLIESASPKRTRSRIVDDDAVQGDPHIDAASSPTQSSVRYMSARPSEADLIWTDQAMKKRPDTRLPSKLDGAPTSAQAIPDTTIARRRQREGSYAEGRNESSQPSWNQPLGAPPTKSIPALTGCGCRSSNAASTTTTTKDRPGSSRVSVESRLLTAAPPDDSVPLHPLPSPPSPPPAVPGSLASRPHPPSSDIQRRSHDDDIVPSTTLYTFPPRYSTFQHPLTPEELAFLTRNPGLFAQTAATLPTGRSDPVTTAGPWTVTHTCNCGDTCNCLGCIAHPYNVRTLDFVQSIQDLMAAEPAFDVSASRRASLQGSGSSIPDGNHVPSWPATSMADNHYLGSQGWISTPNSSSTSSSSSSAPGPSLNGVGHQHRHHNPSPPSTTTMTTTTTSSMVPPIFNADDHSYPGLQPFTNLLSFHMTDATLTATATTAATATTTGAVDLLDQQALSPSAFFHVNYPSRCYGAEEVHHALDPSCLCIDRCHCVHYPALAEESDGTTAHPKSGGGGI